MGVNYRIFDGHNDILSKLAKRGDEAFFDDSTEGHFDLPRALEGGVAGGLFAVYPPTPPKADKRTGSTHLKNGTGETVEIAPAITERYAREQAIEQVARLFRLERESDDFEVACTPNDLENSLSDQDTLTAVLHFEGAEPLGYDLSHLPFFYEAGVRSLGIVWSRPNAFGHGVPFKRPAGPDIGPGLTSAGKELVRRCNELGIVLDLAHLNEAGFWDVAEISSDPLVVTHTAVHEICASTRNLTDEQIDAVGESGGIVGLIFNVSDIHPEGEQDVEMDLDLFVNHIDYLVDRIGIDHVALGSDFDGTTVPNALGDVASYQRLLLALEERGYTTAEIEKIACKNLVSILKETW